MSNVIHVNECGNGDCQQINVHVNENDRGPQGETGVGVENVAAGENGHLITTLTDGTQIDGGELPKAKPQRIYVGEMDGVNQQYDIPTGQIDPETVSYILVNGVQYSTGYNIGSLGTTITTSFPAGQIPKGRLDIVVNDDAPGGAGGGGEVSSVNGKTGAVVLEAQDVGAPTTQQMNTAIATAVNRIEDEIPTKVSELTNDEQYQTKNQVDSAIESATENLATETQINKTVVTGQSVSTNASTVTLRNTKINIKSGSTSFTDTTLPVASTTQAGVMNSATFQAVQDNAGSIDAILQGAVAINGIPANPTQAQLTAAWRQATQITTIINGAKIYDVTNEKTWTYYTNTATWYPAGSAGSITISNWTSTTPGLVLGSDDSTANAGKLFAESDGTGSVIGWDSLVSAVTGKQDTLTAGDNISIANNVISATDTTYTAGDNITITNNEISADVPELLTSTGQSTTAGMTQKAITDALASAGGIKVLTTDDYNYPINNPSGIAGWMLDDGLYLVTCERGVNNPTYIWMTDSRQINTESQILLMVKKGRSSVNNSTSVWAIGNTIDGASESYGDYHGLLGYDVKSNDGSLVSGPQYALTNYNIANNLTSTVTTKALSANQGKVLKDLIDSLVISGAGAPTTSTVGTVGKLYEDTTNGDLYQCTAVSGSTYTWEKVGGGGSGVQYSDLFADNMVQKQIKIGANSIASSVGAIAIGGASETYETKATNNDAIALGASAIASGLGSVSLGNAASASAQNSVAIGKSSTASVKGEVSFGGLSLSTGGYNNTSYRLLTNVHDPVNDHDAATKKYVDDHSGGSGVQYSDIFADPTTKQQVRIGTSGGAGSYAIMLGNGASCNGPYSVAIGRNSNANSHSNYSVALGDSADCSSATFSVALGSGATVSNTKGVVSVGGSYLGTNGYNGTSYRKITNVYDGENAHDAATLAQGNTLASTAPTTSTVGVVGQLYTDTSTGKLYHCTAVSGSTYTWSEVGGGGSGVQFTDLFADGSTQKKIEIGADAQNNLDTAGSTANTAVAIGAATIGSDAHYAVAIGGVAETAASMVSSLAIQGSASGHSAVALGAKSVASARAAVAIGRGANATAQGQVDFGSSLSSGDGYNSTNYRLLTGLHDPVSAHDAATKGYVDSHAGGGASWGSITGTLSNQTDLQSALDDKQDELTAGTGISIVNNVISATGGDSVKVLTTDDYNYPANNPDGVAAWLLDPGMYCTDKDNGIKMYYGAGQGTNSDDKKSTFVIGAATVDNSKWAIWMNGSYNTPFFLKYTSMSDGSGSSMVLPTIVQNTGTSTGNVMSQKAVTDMMFSNNSKASVSIGNGFYGSVSNNAIGIGNNNAGIRVPTDSVLITPEGGRIEENATWSIGLGAGAHPTQKGQFDVSTGVYTTYGYNNSNYRLLTGLYDPVSDHDAATKGYVDTAVGDIETVLATLTTGTGA